MNENALIRRRLSPDDRKAQLLKAAISCYARMGVERAGHGDIAKLSAVSTATVFNYYPTRDTLTNAVLRHIEQEVLSVFDTPQNPQTLDMTARSKILLLALKIDQIITQRPDVIKVLLNWSVSFGENIRPQFLAFQDNIINKIHTIIKGHEPFGNPGERAEARIIVGAALTYIMMKLDNSDAETLKTFVTRLTHLIPE